MKFDFTKIPGYQAGMSAEDMLKLFGEHEFDVVQKAQLDKTSSEAADWKKKYNATLSEQEKKEAEAAERVKTMETELAALKRDKAIFEHTAKYLALGYAADLAADTAKALADGDLNKVFDNGAKHQEAMKANIKTELLKSTPEPGASTPNGVVDYRKMAQEAQSAGNGPLAVFYTTKAHEQNIAK